MNTAIKAIKNEHDYDAALLQIDELFNALEGSDEANLRDVLVLLGKSQLNRTFCYV